MARVALEFQVGGEVESCTLTTWHVAVGERVRAGQPLVELEADKATVEFVAPCDGVLEKIALQEGTEFKPGAVLGWLTTETNASRVDSTTANSTIGFHVRGRCSRCGAAVAINSPLVAPWCSECGANDTIAPSVWQTVLRAAMSGEDRFGIDRGSWSMEVFVSRNAPSCHNCTTKLDLSNAGGSVVCTTCRTSHRYETPPPWLRESFPRVRAVLGALEPRRTPRPHACESCKTTTPPGITVPIPRCPACGRDARPPEPAPIARRWTLVAD